MRGRLERAVITGAGVPVYVDYAHTPDALEAAIAALRAHVEGKLIVVFGAGGDRDQGKRPQMGSVAVKMSDVVIVTDDNPRSGEPQRIGAGYRMCRWSDQNSGPARSHFRSGSAIASGDIVLVAGKGHETGQIVGDRVLPFDDALVARECAA